MLIGVEVCATPTVGGAALCDTTDLNGRYLLEVPAGSYSVAPTGQPLRPDPHHDHALHGPGGRGPAVSGRRLRLLRQRRRPGRLGGTIWQDLPVNDVTDGALRQRQRTGHPQRQRQRDPGQQRRQRVGHRRADPGHPQRLRQRRIPLRSPAARRLPGAGVGHAGRAALLRRHGARPQPRPGQQQPGPALRRHSGRRARPTPPATSAIANTTSSAKAPRRPGHDRRPGLVRRGSGRRLHAAAGDMGVAGVTLAVRVSGAPTICHGHHRGYGQYVFTGLPLGPPMRCG